ncbi:MAG: Verru_Chthon cassette protein D, partial [Verrucomicrobiota bacterium]
MIINEKPETKKTGFSLVEMLIVLGVVGLLLAFSAPNLFSVITANSLTGEGVLLDNQLTFAQQIAVSKSADVEIRFFKLADESAAQTEEAYRAYQLFQFNNRGELIPISAFFRIRPPVALSEELSTILTARGRGTEEDRRYGFDSPRTGSAPAPVGLDGSLSDTPYISFRFR